MVRDGIDHDISAIPDDTLVLLNRATLVQHTRAHRRARDEQRAPDDRRVGGVARRGGRAAGRGGAGRDDPQARHSRSRCSCSPCPSWRGAAPPAVRTIDVGALCERPCSCAATSTSGRPSPRCWSVPPMVRRDAGRPAAVAAGDPESDRQRRTGARRSHGRQAITVSVGLDGRPGRQ